MGSFTARVCAALGLFAAVAGTSQAYAQNATVTLGSEKQYIRGFGGIAHAAWVGDLTATERSLAFGSSAGQLGFSVLRIPVTDGNPDAVNVATAKAAIAAGAIVFASPWNAAKTYTSGDFAAYATHLNNFVSYMKDQGVDLYAISVQNEPDYGSEAGWGSWSASACHDFVLNYGATITTKLVSCESFNYSKAYYDPILNDAAALANVDILGTHLYGTAVNAYAYPLFDSKGAGKERWMTEHYTDSTTDANSWPNALGVASELHNAMVTGQFSAYVWWTLKRSYGPVYNGAVTKRGYCMGHWSKFIRPGFHRVDATATPASGLSLSAYKGDSSAVIVVVNTNTTSSALSISLPGSTLSTFTKYTTSSTKSLASDGMVNASNGSLAVTLDASSVTSLVALGDPGSGGSAGMGGSGTGGSGAGGSAGAAGTSGTGGAAAAGGIGGNAGGGSSATGGGLPSAGSTAGGTLGVGGSAPSGGSTQSGGANAGANSSAGGPTAGTLATTNEVGPSDTSGCSCRLPRRSGSTSNPLALFGLLGGAALARRFGSRRRAPSAS